MMHFKNLLIGAGLVLAVGVLAEHTVVKPVMAQVRAALVQNTDEPGRNAFALQYSNSTLNPYFAEFTVPAGKRYVIDQYSSSCDVVSSTSMSQVQISTTLGGVTTSSYAPAHIVQFNGSISGTQVYRHAATGTGPLYADQGTTITLFANAIAGTGFTNQKDCDFSIQGHSITL